MPAPLQISGPWDQGCPGCYSVPRACPQPLTCTETAPNAPRPNSRRPPGPRIRTSSPHTSRLRFRHRERPRRASAIQARYRWSVSSLTASEDAVGLEVAPTCSPGVAAPGVGSPFELAAGAGPRGSSVEQAAVARSNAAPTALQRAHRHGVKPAGCVMASLRSRPSGDSGVERPNIHNLGRSRPRASFLRKARAESRGRRDTNRLTLDCGKLAFLQVSPSRSSRPPVFTSLLIAGDCLASDCRQPLCGLQQHGSPEQDGFGIPRETRRYARPPSCPPGRRSWCPDPPG